MKEIGVERQTILKRVSNKLIGEAYTGLIWLRICTSAGLPTPGCGTENSVQVLCRQNAEF